MKDLTLPSAGRCRRHSISALSIIALCGAIACSGPDVSTTESGDVVIRENSCASCRAVAESVTFIPHPDDSVAIRGEIAPAIDSRGRYYIAAKSGAAILAFGPDGRLIRSIGKAGSGPGEFARVQDIYAGAGDTLFVSDGRRIHVISPAYELAREFVADVGGSGLFGTILPGNRMLFQSGDHKFRIVTSPGTTLPEVSLEGVDTTSRLCGDCGERLFRASRTPGLVWSGPQNMYRLELHDTLGKLVRRIVREVEWFEPWGGEGSRQRDDSPVGMFRRPRMFGVSETEDGILWAHVWSLFETTDEEVRQAMSVAEKTRDESLMYNLIRARVEAIDLQKQVLLGMVSLPRLTVPISGNLSAQLQVDEAGDWSWKIIRLTIHR
jgi:hypothetical protein